MGRDQYRHSCQLRQQSDGVRGRPASSVHVVTQLSMSGDPRVGMKFGVAADVELTWSVRLSLRLTLGSAFCGLHWRQGSRSARTRAVAVRTRVRCFAPVPFPWAAVAQTRSASA